MLKIDLNSDLAEGFGDYVSGDDAQMLKIVTSANVACGFHAGDPEIMANTFRIAKENGVAVGAHPGFPDLWGFGRRRMEITPDELYADTIYQIGAIAGAADPASAARHLLEVVAIARRARPDAAGARR